MSNELATTEPKERSVKAFLALPQYKSRFDEVLRDRAPQFMASLVTLANDQNLVDCEPRSIIAAAVVAATLDFPLEKALGFAHIVPYRNGDTKIAQFQMAAKGYVQLALRSGQYQRMNAKPISKEAFGGYDEVGEPVIRWENNDETVPPVGYAVAWRLANGFVKTAYWSKEKVEAHARRFSKAYAKNLQSSPWFTNFDKMALKTVVMNELRYWGLLSVQMQKAIVHDGGGQADIDAEVEAVDLDLPADVEAAPVKRNAAPRRTDKGVASVKENPSNPVAEKPAETPPPTQEKALEQAVRAASLDTIELDQVLTVPAEVISAQAIGVMVQGKPTASVKAIVKCEGNDRQMFHIGGASDIGGKMTPNELYKPGAKVMLTVKGMKNTAGKTMPVIESIGLPDAGKPAEEF